MSSASTVDVPPGQEIADGPPFELLSAAPAARRKWAGAHVWHHRTADNQAAKNKHCLRQKSSEVLSSLRHLPPRATGQQLRLPVSPQSTRRSSESTSAGTCRRARRACCRPWRRRRNPTPGRVIKLGRCPTTPSPLVIRPRRSAPGCASSLILSRPRVTTRRRSARHVYLQKCMRSLPAPVLTRRPL